MFYVFALVLSRGRGMGDSGVRFHSRTHHQHSMPEKYAMCVVCRDEIQKKGIERIVYIYFVNLYKMIKCVRFFGWRAGDCVRECEHARVGEYK